MPVYDRSYRRWDGEIRRRALRFVPITAMGVRNALAMKGGWFFTLALRLFMVASIIPTLILFFFNYAFAFRPDFLPPALLGFLDELAPCRAIQYPLLTRMNVLFLMVYTVLFGSGLIARDRASGALPLYLSRPLTLADYVLGKAGVIAWFVAAFTLIPNLILWTFGVITDPSETALRDAAPHLGPILAQNGAVIAVYSLSILAVSSLCRRPMFAGLIWFTLFVLIPVLTFFVAAQLETPGLTAISPNDALFAIGYDLFDVAALFERATAGVASPQERGAIQGIFGMVDVFAKTPPVVAWTSVVAWSGTSLLVLLGVLRRQDVVVDAATR
jgi:ABC-2 type transport system permease protein